MLPDAPDGHGEHLAATDMPILSSQDVQGISISVLKVFWAISAMTPRHIHAGYAEGASPPSGVLELSWAGRAPCSWHDHDYMISPHGNTHDHGNTHCIAYTCA